MHKTSSTSFTFQILFFFLDKSFFKPTPAKHRTNLPSILRSQLFTKSTIYIEYIYREKETRLKKFTN